MVGRIPVSNKYQHFKRIKKLGYVLKCFLCGGIFINKHPKAYCSLTCKQKTNQNSNFKMIFGRKIRTLNKNICMFYQNQNCTNINILPYESRAYKCPYNAVNRKECKYYKPVYDINKINEIKNEYRKKNT